MSEATFRFYGELNDFLPARRQDREFVVPFQHRAAIKDMIESLGVPHPEVEAILANNVPVNWSYIVQDHDHITIHPASTSPDLAPDLRVGPPAPVEARFVLDAHLGKLAAYLRLLGFDSLYRNDFLDAELARISAAENRILLTRDRNLLKRSIVVYGYFVRATDPRRQVVEIVRRFDLVAAFATYRRCIRCNGVLEPVDKAEIEHLLAPKTRVYYDDFQICRDCHQIYWKGSHFEPLQQFIDRVVQNDGNAEPRTQSREGT